MRLLLEINAHNILLVLYCSKTNEDKSNSNNKHKLAANRCLLSTPRDRQT